MKTKLLTTLAITVATAVLSLTLVGPAAGQPAPTAPEAARAAYEPTWHKVHFHMNAYSGAGHLTRCEGSYRDDFGKCFGQGETGLSAPSYPFDHEVTWVWWRQRPGFCTNEFPGHRDHATWSDAVWISGRGTSSLCGWVDPHWGTYVVTGGRIPEGGAYRSVHASNAHVAQREHTKGGPLFVHLAAHGHGYVLGLRGWLFY